MSYRIITVPLIVAFHIVTLGTLLLPHLLLAGILRLGRRS